MRLCEKNKRDIWYSSGFTTVEELDSDGNYTGAIVKTRITPTKSKVNLYPSNGEISQALFGSDCNFDYVLITVGNVFTKDTAFYLTQPSNADKIEYIVSNVKDSLNNTAYALQKVK